MALKDKTHKIEKNKNLLSSFSHAYDGIKEAIVKEKNMHIHILMGILVIFAAAYFEISYVEWLICIILIGLVISFELINTAIESVVDMITTEENKFAKAAKDTSAGAVLVISIMSAVIGTIIFLPKVIEFITNL
jgi:diacylglycerol kinase